MIIDELLPNALMIGVDYDLFWTLNPKSLKPFIKAFVLKQKYDDRIAWQNGAYVRMAIASALNKSAKYPTAPLLNDRNLVQETPEEKQDKIKQKMFQQMAVINGRFRKEDNNG